MLKSLDFMKGDLGNDFTVRNIKFIFGIYKKFSKCKKLAKELD